MAWNGSNSATPSVSPASKGAKDDGIAKRKLKSAGKSPSLLRGLTAGIVVVAFGGAALWWFGRTGVPPPVTSAEKPTTKISEVQQKPVPAAVSNVQEKSSAKPKKPKLSPTQVMGKRGIPIETYGLKTYWTNGVLRYEGGLRVYDPNRPSKKLTLLPPEPEIFKRHSLNSIASIITHEPGDLLVGDLEYGEDFVIDFNDSLSESIEYDEKDTEYSKQVKDAVKEVQKELRGMMDRGEDIALAMNDARADLRNLSQYRQEILSMVSEGSDKEEASDLDVEDLIKAANKMLREKGVKEIGDSEIVRWSLILEQRREQGADEHGSEEPEVEKQESQKEVE